MTNYCLNNNILQPLPRLFASVVALLSWACVSVAPISAAPVSAAPLSGTPDTFKPQRFAHQLNDRLSSFLDQRRTISLSELGDLTRWNLLVPSELPKRGNGKPRPFTRRELTAVVSELASTMGLPPSTPLELSGEHAMVLSIAREEILSTYPNAQVIVEARDGLVYSLLAQMRATTTRHTTIGAISFPYIGRNHPSAEAPMYTAHESNLIESVMERARQILRGVLLTVDAAGNLTGGPLLNNAARRDSIVGTFIAQFNAWFESDTSAGGPSTETKQLIDRMLGAQIKALSLDQHKPIIIFDTHGYGIKVLIGAARLQAAFPKATFSVALIESFNHPLNAQQQAAIPPITTAPLRDIRVTWPFTLTELDKNSGLPMFRPVSPRSPSALLEWVTALLLMYNRATIGDDHALWKEWQSAARSGSNPFSDPKFIERYTFGDSR